MQNFCPSVSQKFVSLQEKNECVHVLKEAGMFNSMIVDGGGWVGGVKGVRHFLA